jgi:hypothetical protein
MKKRNAGRSKNGVLLPVHESLIAGIILLPLLLSIILGKGVYSADTPRDSQPCLEITSPTASDTLCPGAGQTFMITWDTCNAQIAPFVRLKYCNGDCSQWKDSIPNLGVYYWPIPGYLTDSTRIIMCTQDELVCDTTDYFNTECGCIPGDDNGDGKVDMLDVIHEIAILYKGGTPVGLYPNCQGDPDGSCSQNMMDILFKVAYLYKNGPEPIDCCTWRAACGPLRQ